MKKSHYWTIATLFLAVACGLLLVDPLVTQAGTLETDYRDFTHDTDVPTSPTGEKPENKRWWNDGVWWGSQWSPTVADFSTATPMQAEPPVIDPTAGLVTLSRSTMFLPVLFKTGFSRLVFETRPYTNDSPWNTPIGSSPKYDPHSERMVATLGGYSEGRITSNSNEYSYTLYFTDASTPRWDIPCASENCTVVRPEGISKTSVLQGVPIPLDARPAGGSDSPMIIVDRDTLNEYNLRGVVRTANGWTAENGALYNITYNGTPTRYSTRGSGVPYFAGLIRPWEVAQGRIEHVIGFAYPAPSIDRCVYPASKTDGDNPDPNAIPEGARLQLDPSLTEADFDRMGLDLTGKIIARALQQYGMVVVNVSGRPKITVENLADNPYATFQWSDPPYNLTPTSIANIPYTYFRVLALPESYWNPSLGGSMHGRCYK